MAANTGGLGELHERQLYGAAPETRRGAWVPRQDGPAALWRLTAISTRLTRRFCEMSSARWRSSGDPRNRGTPLSLATLVPPHGGRCCAMRRAISSVDEGGEVGSSASAGGVGIEGRDGKGLRARLRS